ncbi:MAG: PQQ-dependent sugar dehydrogenase, partial [Hymenobacteraceae bacterium]|nr:PQQ-dependent sugar dehydrogenase [Hymenobacteraceae bacterium]MDX5395138.1 PQQ-dependent sugar dehydrogenase [Hymenobacteraceae bacterium]MDX5511179.1 PQQ-dependent sugar dehydrogenase [Hymenobacteraceae bacterium]
MKKLCLLSLSLLLLSGCYRTRSSSGGGQDVPAEAFRTIKPADIALPEGYQIEAIATGLTFPTAAAVDEQGNVYVIEAGYSYGEVFLEPKLIRINKDGSLTTVASGSKNGPWTGVQYHNGNFYVAEGGQLEGGKILKISKDGKITALVENLPSFGDHHTNGPAIGPDNYIYFGQGTATNSAVVGKDNADFGWLMRYPEFHDIPCQDITLKGKNYQSENPLTEAANDKATTGAYVPFGTATTEGQVIKGQVPCTGAIMRVPLQGGQPELVAWGFRNPYGLAFSPNGQLYITENGYDDRGSRPVWGTGDYVWKVKPGTWYGWPDFAGGIPFHKDHFAPPGGPAPGQVLAKHPNTPPKPAAALGVHSSSNGIDFSRSNTFGYNGHAFIAQFGDMAPGVGKVLAPVGYKVVRVDVETGVVQDFAANQGKENGPASLKKSGGLERPVSVKFSPDGTALYIVDFGVMTMSERGPAPETQT